MINLNDQGQVFPSANRGQPNDGNPAFPFKCQGPTTAPEIYYGMTLREYAAIKLRVPESGTDWLDAMIRVSLRDELATKALPIAWKAYDKGYTTYESEDVTSGITGHAYRISEAMLRAREAA